jgi:hypothetical protein
MNEFECVIPILNVKNFAVSMDYYVNKLGFRKKWDWGDPPTFGLCHAGQGRDFFLRRSARTAWHVDVHFCG